MTEAVDKYAQPVLNDENRLKLALFGINLQGGVTLADVEGKCEATWPENVRYATLADRIGIDAIVPVARWRGYGGRANLGERSFETFTWAAGLLACTFPSRTRCSPRRCARPPTMSPAAASG